MIYKFMEKLVKEVKVSFNSLLNPNFLSGKINPNQDEQQAFLVTSNKQNDKGLYLVIVATNDKCFCPIFHRIDCPAKDFIHLLYGEDKIKAPLTLTDEDHRQAVKNALDYVSFYDKKFTLKLVEKRPITDTIISETILDLPAMTEQEALRKIAQISPKKQHGFYKFYYLHELTHC